MSDKPFQAGNVAIKVFIDNQAEIQAEITHLVQSQFPDLSAADIKSKPSQNKKYLSVTYHLNEQEDFQAKLDLLYASLSKHPKIKMVL
jgi:putative lipoic acid-binding regulatory protein